MVVRFTKAIRPIISNLSRQQPARRTLFTPTAIRSADIVQQMYLKELSSYKPPAVKASDADAHVQKFTVPKAPASPEDANLANDLKTYETSAPEIEGAAAEGAPAVVENWFEEDEEPAAASH